jgi:hypothetical protein
MTAHLAIKLFITPFPQIFQGIHTVKHILWRVQSVQCVPLLRRNGRGASHRGVAVARQYMLDLSRTINASHIRSL